MLWFTNFTITYNMAINVPFPIDLYGEFNWLEHKSPLAHRIARPESREC